MIECQEEERGKEKHKKVWGGNKLSVLTVYEVGRESFIGDDGSDSSCK